MSFRSVFLAVCTACAFHAYAGLLDATPAPASSSQYTPVERQRGTEQTFLTFPEWFLVHSPAEYAAYVKNHTPTEFPFMGHIGQFWHSYGVVYDASNEGYPFNFGYHVMIMVIGTSTTVEYAIRSAYETLIGRVSQATQTGGLTPEDVYGAKVAQEYVDFIRVRPWYEFDFMAKLCDLWAKTSWLGPDMLRKWERKYALTTEYAIKAAYGWLIQQATHASYDVASDVTAVVLNQVPSAEVSGVVVQKTFPDGKVLALMPRYQAFQDSALHVAKAGFQFEEIAGNRGPILLSVLTQEPESVQWPHGKVLFEQPLLTQPGTRRVALVVQVPELASTLNALQARGVELEHVYDY